ncbi:MAG: AVAST type 1 anti-phage system MBL fold metallo-hydrolase Avs1a [Agitococcus sp.]|nr:AVAST type 1 anti-phage system MBL fold metallo-hydrolase Avs1a [Agitococcus sp.]
MLKVKMYPAKNGDAFLVCSLGTNILIDGGYAETFRQHIVHDLQVLSHQGERLNLVVASHIDADHISGLIALLGLNGELGNRFVVEVDDIWHNSLRSLAVQHAEKLPLAAQKLLESIQRRGYPKPPDGDAREISARQGSSLARLLNQYGYQWNFADGTLSINTELPLIQLGNNSGSVQIINPSFATLSTLLRWWQDELSKLGYIGPSGAGGLLDDAFEFISASAKSGPRKKSVMISAGGADVLEEVYCSDTSVTNRSSIAMIVELNGRRILFLGDAWAEDIVETLQQLQAKGQSLVFDAVKLSHHGSLHNTSPQLLQMIDAPIYFISTNGQGHGHPDFEVLAAIVDRPASFQRTLYFNYQTPASSRLRSHQSKSGSAFAVYEDSTDWINIP